MKKLLLLITLAACTTLAKAQSTSYHAFKVDVTFGYAIPQTSGDGVNVKAGVTFTVEPHYRLSDDLAVGLRMEGAGLGYANTNDANTSNTNVTVSYSFCPSVEYYFTQTGFRPFVSAGAGIFTRSALSVNNDTDNATFGASSSKFGFFPRAGFEVGHFRMSAEYNILGSNANYAAFSIGFFLGGGSKK